MELIKALFPLSFRGSGFKTLLVSVLIYIAIYVVCSLLLGLLFVIPFLGWLRSILGWVVNAYCSIGIVIAILVFLNILKN